MKILISNDDGIAAPGLASLASALSEIAEITVVAPDRERSGSSNSLSLDMPLRIMRQSNGYFAVTGTPTDSVHLAIRGWMETSPDMVVSGINAGSNLGDDILYSGTVAAAMEGRFLGYPAIAFSLVTPLQQSPNLPSAAIIAKKIISKIIQDPLPKEIILNVNIPDLPLSEIKGFQVTRLGHRHIAEKVVPSTDGRNLPIYWIGPAGKEQDAGEGTDFYAVNHGFVSITPIKIDLTDYASMANINTWFNNLKLHTL